MAKRIQSAIKQAREAVKRRARRRAHISALRSNLKQAVVTLSGDAARVQEAEAAVKTAVRKINKAASKGAIHKRQAARRASRLMRKLNAIRNKSAATSPPAG